MQMNEISMADLLAQYGGPVQPKHAQLIEGEVVRIDARLGAWIDFGGKCDALVPADELAHIQLKPGDRSMFQVVDVSDSDEVITLSARRAAGWLSMRKHQEAGDTVSARITRVIGKSGVRVEVEGVHGFVPMSMLGIRTNIDDLVDQHIEVKVHEVVPESRRLILDHVSIRRERAKAARAAEEARQARFDALTDGEIIDGTVAKTAEYGLFVDIGGGLNGLLHKKELPANHTLTVGSTVKVRVVRAEMVDGKRLVALSTKRTERSSLLDSLNVDDVVSGTVTKVVPYGVFVNLGDGAEGLVHRSELPNDIKFERRTLSAGEGILVRVTNVDKEKNRISLSLKNVPSTPSAPQAAPVA